ncbi:hypothetical protein F2Q70_00012038 [Brassica cretica]|uniref:Uncharacterized protein n=1 Tax=Brassica cretica TaxID=69181 RepID=A0A8S9LRE5_BRACR|nr:hypothetical protein F2Q70_00012038 [Brassica cretica]
MIPVTKDNIRKILERASLFEESHIGLPEHATSFTPTKLAPKIYTKDEINEMVTGICGAQETLGDELKTLVDDTYQPLNRGYNELFRSMAEMRTYIESKQHILEKEATTSPSIDANKATSIDVKPHTSQIPAEPESLAEKKNEWEIAYINTKINDKDQQPATSIDICTITSIDSKFTAMEDRASLDVKKPTEHPPYTAAEVDQITSKLYTAIDTMEDRFEKRCDDIYFPFDVRLSGLDSHAECPISQLSLVDTDRTSIDAMRLASVDVSLDMP